MRPALSRGLSCILASALVGCGAGMTWVGGPPSEEDRAQTSFLRALVETTEGAMPDVVVTGVRVLPAPARRAAVVTVRDDSGLHEVVVDLEAMLPMPSSVASVTPPLGEGIPGGSLAEMLRGRTLHAETTAVRVTDLAGYSVTVEESVVDGVHHEHWNLGMGCAGEMYLAHEALDRLLRERARVRRATDAVAGQ